MPYTRKTIKKLVNLSKEAAKIRKEHEASMDLTVSEIDNILYHMEPSVRLAYTVEEKEKAEMIIKKLLFKKDKLLRQENE